jgi:predicted  nucleic acid-binding Zn-ribbon protein
MADRSEQESLRQELQDVEAEIAEQRKLIDDLRSQVGGEGAGAMDAEDVAAILTNVEEIEGVLEGLEQRRERIRRQLGEQQ